MRINTLLVACLNLALLTTVGCSSSNPPATESPEDDTTRSILETRDTELLRMGRAIGIPDKLLLKTRVSNILLCQETGSNGDGSYSCDDECTQVQSCVHAWMLGQFQVYSVEYMFTIPSITRGTKSHEIMHELLVIHYNVGGHPESVTITRLDNGQPMTFKPAQIIGSRWALVPDWAVGTFAPNWSNDIKCGVSEVFEAGAGI